MEINSRITGRRAVSLPFTDYCDPIADNLQFSGILNWLIDYGKKAKWKSIEFRVEHALPDCYPPSSMYQGHVLDLKKTEDELYRNLRDTTRRNIKKAKKAGVAIDISSSLDAVKEFYRLNCLTRRDHGLPPQPYSFFEKLHHHVIAKNLGHIILASRGAQIIAGAVYFHFGEKTVYKYGASDKQYQDVRANNLVMWEAIRHYNGKGYESLSFGRTEQENRGLLQFKSGWGGRQYPIHYYKYDLVHDVFVQENLKLTGIHNVIFRNMPLPFLKLAGELLYKHIG